MPTRAAVMAVNHTATAMAVTTALRFPLGQVARHCFLPPASSARGRRRRAVSRLCIVFGEGQVQGQGEGKASLLLH